jgi:hypothetical protein
MFMRPIKEYSFEVAKSFLELSSSTHIVLEGLSSADIEQIIVSENNTAFVDSW